MSGYLASIRTQALVVWRNRDLQRNALLAFGSTMIAALVGLVAAPILAGLLPREEYGTLSYIRTLQGLVMAFSAPGVVNAISYSVVRGYEGVFRSGTYYRLRIYLRNSLFLFPVAAWYYWREDNALLALVIALGALFLPWMYAFDTGEQFLIGRSDFATIFWRRLAVIVAIAFAGVGAALVMPTALAVFVTRAVVMAVLTAAVFLLLLRTVRNENLDPEFWRKSKDFSLVSILGSVGNLTDSLVLGSLGSLDLLAAYSLASSIAGPLSGISKSFIKLVFGRMAGQKTKQQQRFWLLLSVLMVIAGVPAILASWWLVSPWVLRLFPKYPELKEFVPVLLVVFVFGFANALALSHALFHAYPTWLRYNTWRNASKIPVVAGAVLVSGVWGALYVRLGYAILDYVVFTFSLWRSQRAGHHSAGDIT